MKKILDNVKQFYKVKVIDDNTIHILTPFLMKDTDQTYPICLKKIQKKYLLNDAGILIDFMNEYEIEIDNDKMMALLDEYSKLLIDDNNVVIYETHPDTFVFDLASFIQIITRIIN